MIVRRFEAGDAPRVCEIFYRSVHEVASAQYDQAQIRAWAPKVPDPEQWFQRLHDYDTFVADNDKGETVGWIATSPEGYIDMLFCLPEAVGRGVAARLYIEAERTVIARGLTQLTAHASLLAQPFFERHGWVIDKHETVVRNGVEIPRAAMSKRLSVPNDLIGQRIESIGLRRAVASDAEPCCAIIRNSITRLCELDHLGNEQHITNRLSNKTVENVQGWIEHSHFFVAEFEGHIVGVGAMLPSGKITLNYVSPDVRFRGVSDALIRCLEQTAIGLGLDTCTLESSRTALRFYQERGYVKSTESHLLPLTGTMAIVLSKRLVRLGSETAPKPSRLHEPR